LTQEPDIQYMIKRRDGLSNPMGLEQLRPFVRSGVLRRSTVVHIKIHEGTLKRRARRIPEICEMFAEAKCLRLVTKIYKNTRRGRIRRAAREAGLLKKNSATIKGDPFASDAQSFIRAIEDTKSEGSLARSITWLVAGLACIGIIIIFVSSASRTASELNAELLTNVSKVNTDERQKAFLAELDAACYLIDHSPHIRLARFLHVGPDEGRITEIRKLSIKVSKAVNEDAWKKELADEAVQLADNLILKNRYSESLQLAINKINQAGVLNSEKTIEHIRTRIQNRVNRYFNQKKARIIRLLELQDFDGATAEIEDLNERIPDGFLTTELDELTDQLPMIKKINEWLIQARLKALKGKTEQCELLLGRIEKEIGDNPEMDEIKGQVKEIRQVARKRALINLVKTVEEKVQPLAAVHKYGEGLALLEKEGRRNKVLEPYIRMQTGAIREKMDREIRQLDNSTASLCNAHDYKGARELIARYGKTGIRNADNTIDRLNRETVAKAFAHLKTTRERAEKLVLYGKRKKGELTITSLPGKSRIPEIKDEFDGAVAFIMKVSKGYNDLNIAKNYKNTRAYDIALEYIGKALRVLPANHQLVEKALSMRNEIKKEQKK